MSASIIGLNQGQQFLKNIQYLKLDYQWNENAVAPVTAAVAAADDDNHTADDDNDATDDDDDDLYLCNIFTCISHPCFDLTSDEILITGD